MAQASRRFKSSCGNWKNERSGAGFVRQPDLASVKSLITTEVPIRLAWRYGEIDMSIGIMAGKGDRMVYVDKNAGPLARHVKGIELRLTPDQRHLFHYAVPHQVADGIAAIGAGR